MGGLIFGFDADGEMTTPADQLAQQDGIQVETFTVSPGETVTDETGDISSTYTATREDT
ncbi:hypothetical protein AB0958_09785 [Streptomyces sp. NPDC006655]|uniref:hypothetical protein n=1 Tax=Streptomyces sp. NPDC006655 TaxID=3156898 RepID=UPI003453EDE3